MLVSGGGWGVGDIEGAVAVALGRDGVSRWSRLCGHNAGLLARVAARFGDEPRVRAEGFTDRDARLARRGRRAGPLDRRADRARGADARCPAISYGWGRGHVRINNRAFERFGLARVVASRDGLGVALRETLDEPRLVDPRFAVLPSASSFVLALASDDPSEQVA